MKRACSTCHYCDTCDDLARLLAKVSAPASKARVLRGVCGRWRAAREGDEAENPTFNPMHENCQDVASGEKHKDSKHRGNMRPNFRSDPTVEERHATHE